MIVTTNPAFSEWPQIFVGDEKLAVALIDRLADRHTIIATRASARLKQRLSRAPNAFAGLLRPRWQTAEH